MAEKPTQKNRELAIATPLGEDVLLLKSMSGIEQLGRPFEYKLELASEDHQIKPEDIVGQNVTIRLNLPGQDDIRYFNGHISSFTQLEISDRMALYQATVVPWLWFLTRTADCRIFQDKTIPEIIKEVFKKHGFTNFEDGLTGNYSKWEYCVQYRETDFNFVSRLMEQEGICYFFKHENGKHLLVLSDSSSAHEPYPNFEQLEYHPADKGTKPQECISEWIVETNLQSGSYALNDFDFKNTTKDLLTRAKVDHKHSSSTFEIYDYPGKYTQSGDGRSYARQRIEELDSQYKVAMANSDSRGICAGFTFELTGHPRQEQKKHLITSASYNIDAGEFFSAQQHGEFFIACTFTAINADNTFRPPRITPKPSISGPQTAMVVGPSKQEIYADEHGRVKVKFHWDHNSKADENSSCWIRVAQVWAGKNWGALYTPRIGQEVIVDFLEGDPDRPIITGRVYNGQAKPPYDPKKYPTISTLKSNSSKGGGGFNEIRIEDKKKEEQVFIHAEKDLHIRVKNDRYEIVKNDHHLIVEKEKFEHIKNHRNEFVDKNHLEEIGKDRNLTVKGKEAKEVEKNLSLTVKGNVEEEFKKDHTETTTMNYTLKAAKVTIEAKGKIELKVGASSITMDPAQIELNAPKVSVNGSGIVQVQGALVKIN